MKMFIDIHVHTRRVPCFPRNNQRAYASPEMLIEQYNLLDIRKGVLLPGVNPECMYGVQAVEDIIEIANEYDPRFIPFCNIDPRAMTNSPDAPLDEMMMHYKELGCKGIGEVCANFPFNHPLMKNLFSCAEKVGLPLIFHVAPALGSYYGIFDEINFPFLEKSLQQFPELIFLGHSQAFWAEIAPLNDPEERKGYPKGNVTEPGRVVELMRTYSNLHGDLSANSGYNAISRDPEFGVEFLDEFQDRLYFGTDICAPNTPTPLVDHLLSLKEEKKISRRVFDKIARENAVKLLKL